MSFEGKQLGQLIGTLSSSTGDTFSLSHSQLDSSRQSSLMQLQRYDGVSNNSGTLVAKQDSFHLSHSADHQTVDASESQNRMIIDNFMKEQQRTRSNEEFIQYTLQNFEQIKRTMQTSELDNSSVILAINNIKSQIKSLRLERMSDMTEKQAQTRVRYLEVENQRQMKKVDFWTRVLQGQISRQ